MSSKDDSPGSTCKSIVTQMYTFSSWSKQKAVANGHASCSMLPYVGFPGLSLTPIPENPLLDPSLNEDALTPSERDRWLAHDEVDLLHNGSCRNGHGHHHHQHHHNPIRNGSLPKHWLGNGTLEGPTSIEEIENGGGGGKDCDGRGPRKASPSKASSCAAAAAVNVHVVQTTTFLPKEEALTREEKRAHLCKLLLFALCGFVIVAGIVLWIFSPAFT